MTKFFVVGLVFAAVTAARAETAAGAVTYVANKDAFLDAGKLDGLSTGLTIDLVRRQRKVGRCEVVEVSDHRALCRSQRASFARGDRFAVQVTPPSPPTPPSPGPPDEPRRSRDPADEAAAQVPRPKLKGPTAAELDERAKARAAVQSAALPKIAKRVQPRPDIQLAGRGLLSVRQQAWTLSTAPGGSFARTSIDALARGAIEKDGLPHIFGATALRVSGDLLAPSDQRMRPGEPVELYVWGASVGVDKGPVVGEVGRFYGRMLPGMPLLDGAQLGVRLLEERLELGVYGGLVPELVTLAPALRRVVGGVYVGLDIIPFGTFMVLPRARVGIASTPKFDAVRTEVEALNDLFVGNLLRVGASVRAGLAEGTKLAPSLDAARIDSDLFVLSSVRVFASYRYLAPLGADFDAAPKIPSVGGTHNSDAGVSVAVTNWMNVSARGGFGYDIVDESWRAQAGPEVTIPRGLGDLGGFSVGYAEEFGSWPGRTGWFSTTWNPISLLRLTNRLSYFELEAPGDSYREFGLTVLADAPILPWLSIHGRGYGQQALPALDKSSRSTPTVVLVDVAATARF